MSVAKRVADFWKTVTSFRQVDRNLRKLVIVNFIAVASANAYASIIIPGP